MYRDCTKEVTECDYRFDYRGCSKGNCPFPNEYEQIKPKIVEDKIELNYRDYKIMKIGNYCSVGMIGKEYAFEILTGIGNIPEYYPISKEEFNTFDKWRNDIDKIVKEIKNRKLLCSGYKHN